MYKVYGKTSCKYCRLLKKEFTEMGVLFEYIDLEESPERRSEYTESHVTIPAILFNEEFVGGYTDLLEFFNYEDVL